MGNFEHSQIVFCLQVIVLAACIVICLLAAAEKFRGWPEKKLKALRDVMTALLGITSLAAVAGGRWTLAPICLFLLLPLLRASLDPDRGKLTEAQKQAVAAAMTREDALRLLELEAEEADKVSVQVAYDRLQGLAASRKGGANAFYATRLAAARDFLLSH